MSDDDDFMMSADEEDVGIHGILGLKSLVNILL
jgi:hypothetical protein